MQVKKAVAGDPDLAIHAPRFIRWFDLLWLEAVLFNAFMAFIIKCRNPFPPHGTPLDSPCVFWTLVAHLGVLLLVLSCEWRGGGPDLAARFDLGDFLKSPGQIKWEATVAVIGSFIFHMVFRIMNV